MGRAPCCDKANVKKGPWSPEEDAKLKAYIEQHGTGGNWIALPQKIGLKRCGKSCRLRWLNYLRPNIKHGGFSEEEDNIICSLYISIGSRWSIIAAQLPGRTDNDIKNYWNTRLKKKLLGKQRKEHQARKANYNLKHEEMRKGCANLALSSSGSQNHYYPLPPELAIPTIMPNNMPYPNDHQDQVIPINDQTSIRKLLIKLGGRFSSDYHHQQQLEDNAHDDQNTNNLQDPLDLSPTHHQFYDENPNNSSIPSSSAASTNSLANNSSQLLLNYNGQCDLDIAASVHMLQGIHNNFQVHHDEFGHEISAYGNISSGRIEGLLDCNNMPGNGCCCSSPTTNTTGPISAESTSWDCYMGPLAYFQVGSAEFDRVQPGMLQAVAYNGFEDSRYIGLQ